MWYLQLIYNVLSLMLHYTESRKEYKPGMEDHMKNDDCCIVYSRMREI